MSKQLKDVKEGEIVVRVIEGVPMQLIVRIRTPNMLVCQPIERTEPEVIKQFT